jgi:hypothetical protein
MDFLTPIENLLDMPAAERVEVMRELTSHYEELCREMIASGMSDSQARQEAAHRLGNPPDIAARLNAVHNSASWRSALATIAPIVVAVIVFDCLELSWSKSLALSITAYLAAAILTGSLIIKTSAEIRADRRPVWLATWLAASITCGHCLLRLTAIRICSATVGVEFSPFGLYVGSYAAVAAFFALATCWRSPKCRTAAAFGSALMVLYAVAAIVLRLTVGTWGEEALRDFGRIVHFALWIVVALRVFAHHRYGCSLQASLFLYAYFCLGWQLTTFAEGSWLNWVYPETLAAAIVVLICVRSHSWWRKTAALLGGVIAIDCVYPLYHCLFVSKGAVFALANVSTVPFDAVTLSLNLLLMGAAVALPPIIAGQDSQPHVQIVG